MIIDSHTHLGRNNHIKLDAKGLLQSMDAAKIDKALVFAGEMNDCPNEWMIKQIKPHRDRLFGVAAYDNSFFRYTDFKEMIEDNGLVGIKFYTGYEHYYPIEMYQDIKEPRTPLALFSNPLQICSELKIPAIFHCGDCLNSVKHAKLKFAHPLNIDEPAVDYDDVNFVIAHMGYPWHRDAAQVCYKNSNVYADISGFVYGEFDLQDQLKFKDVLQEFLSIADTDKLLFGTDAPISNQASYREAMDWIGNVTMDSKMRKGLTPQNLSKNTKRIFNLT